MVNEVLVWLPGVIDGNGLVSYWPGSTGYVSLTAWVTEFLVEARNAGFAIDQAMLDRLIGALQQALRSDYTHFITGEAYTERVMALRALAAAGRLDASYVAELARRADYLNLESSAEVWRLLNTSGNQAPTASQELSKKVWDGVVIRQYQGHEIYGGLQETASARNGLILPSETRTLAEVARASASSPKADPRLRRPDRRAGHARPGRWLGLHPGQRRGHARLVRLHQAQGCQQGSPEAASGHRRANANAGDRPRRPGGADRHQQRGEDRDALGRQAAADRARRDQLSAAGTGLRGAIRSERLRRHARNAAPARHRRTGGQNRAEQARHDRPPAVGDVIEEHVEVVSNANHHYVAVVVPLAAGLEPLNPKLATAPPEATPSGAITATPSYVAYLDDQVAFYYDELPKGAYHFYFRTRATVPGKFTQPQARAELMYDGAVHGESVGARVEVSAKAK